MIVFLGLLFLPLLFLLKIIVRVHKNSNKQLPPGPLRLPIIGNLHQLGGLPHVSLSQLSKRYGPVMFLQLGYVPTVIISSPEAAEQILKTHDLETCSRPPLMGLGRLSYNNADVSFSPYGDYWREMKKICVLELLTVKRVKFFQFVREEEVAMLIDSISESSSASLPVDIGAKMVSLTADITCRMAFGKSFRERGFGEDHGRFQEVNHEALDMLGRFCAADFFPYVGWIIDRFTGLHTRFEKTFQELDSFFQQVIDDHIQAGNNQEHEDIVDILLKLVGNQSESSVFCFGQKNVKAVLMDIFLAGIDTSAVAVLWSMTELIRNQKIMRKAQEEIRAFVGWKGKVSETDIDHLTYLKMVLKETLRLHPPAPLLLPRETISEIKINGYRIYPKTLLQINVWAMGRDPKTWENPEEFYPERFMDSNIDYKGQNYKFIPFGAGRRICPGINLGMCTAELALANLLYCFDWKLPDNMNAESVDMEEASGLSTSKKTPLMLFPIRYQPPATSATN